MLKKKDPTPQLLLAQEEEIRQLIDRLQTQEGSAVSLQEMEVLLRTAVFKPTKALVAYLFQRRADHLDATYQPKIGETRKGREALVVECIFGMFKLERDLLLSPRQKAGPLSSRCGFGFGRGV